MKNIFLALYCFLISTFLYAQTYPETKKTTTNITKHNISYQDDYTWLEDMRSPEVVDWVSKQNALVDVQSKEIKKSVSFETTIKIYDENTTYSLPKSRGKYLYAFYGIDRKKSPALYMLKNLNANPIEIVNPNKIYPDKNVTIDDYSPSKNSTHLAYSIGVNGSDRHEIKFQDLFKNKPLTDHLKDIKFSDISWNKDCGIFYNRNSNKSQFAKDSTFQLYYHRLNTPQSEDQLVFDVTKNEGSYSFFTFKTKLFVIEFSKDEKHKNYYYADLGDPAFTLKKMIDEKDQDFTFINFRNDRVYFATKKSNWGEIRSFDLSNPSQEKLIIPQIYTHLLEKTFFSDDYLICKYKTLGKNYFIVYDYEGKLVKKIDVPNGMDVVFMNFVEETKDLYFGVTSYTLPYRNFKVNILTGWEEPVFGNNNRAKPTLFPLNYFETKTISYKNRDNIDVPITIIYKKGLALNSNNPTLLEAYGGFGYVSKPLYDTGLLYFLEKGGVYAYAEIRGGGEKGIKWAVDGKGLKKVNGLNDFIDAAEFLIKEKYTSSNKLAITGASQGGLVVGYALTQKPELFKLAIPKVGVFDILNTHKYTVGRFHLDEYGNPDVEEDFKSMLNYSPLNNIKGDVNYPTTLIITSDNDDRVPALHSYKFAALLQNRSAQKNPIFLRTKNDMGHQGANSYEKWVQEKAEFYNFLLYYLNQ